MLPVLSVITNLLQYSTTSLSFLGVNQVSCFSQIVLKTLHLHKTWYYLSTHIRHDWKAWA
jgi:hypothetical protein